MKCPKCQHDNPGEAKFCEACATPIARLCAQLREPGVAYREILLAMRTCARWQRRGRSRSVAQKLHSAAPHRQILITKAALEGERKQVTVLFADIKGSMEVIADAIWRMRRSSSTPSSKRMIEAVHHYEGTVNSVMGDGIMALFGAPLAHEDHAVRACYAALRMQESIARYSDEVQRTHSVPIMVRVGVNSGEIVISAIGNDLHMEYTVVGQTVHLAARMEQMAMPGSVLSPPTPTAGGRLRRHEVARPAYR